MDEDGINNHPSVGAFLSLCHVSRVHASRRGSLGRGLLSRTDPVDGSLSSGLKNPSEMKIFADLSL